MNTEINMVCWSLLFMTCLAVIIFATVAKDVLSADLQPCTIQPSNIFNRTGFA